MVKYKAVYQEMVAQNRPLFENFKKVHDQYFMDPKKWQTEYNQVGETVQDIIRKYENRLCSHSENSGYGKFSSTLSDKFHEEIKKNFPKIDSIGLLSWLY